MSVHAAKLSWSDVPVPTETSAFLCLPDHEFEVWVLLASISVSSSTFYVVLISTSSIQE